MLLSWAASSRDSPNGTLTVFAEPSFSSLKVTPILHHSLHILLQDGCCLGLPQTTKSTYLLESLAMLRHSVWVSKPAWLPISRKKMRPPNEDLSPELAAQSLSTSMTMVDNLVLSISLINKILKKKHSTGSPQRKHTSMPFGFHQAVGAQPTAPNKCDYILVVTCTGKSKQLKYTQKPVRA